MRRWKSRGNLKSISTSSGAHPAISASSGMNGRKISVHSVHILLRDIRPEIPRFIVFDHKLVNLS